jgi:hypothetical protein
MEVQGDAKIMLYEVMHDGFWECWNNSKKSCRNLYFLKDGILKTSMSKVVLLTPDSRCSSCPETFCIFHIFFNWCLKHNTVPC